MSANKKERILLVLSFLRERPPTDHFFKFGGVDFHVIEHCIGWDFDTAKALIQQYDGYADGIVMKELLHRVSFNGSLAHYHRAHQLALEARRTPVYWGMDLLETFANWTLWRIQKSSPEFLRGRKVLFHAALLTPYTKTVLEAGARWSAADAMLLLEKPVLLNKPWQMHALLKSVKVVMSSQILEKRRNLFEQMNKVHLQSRLLSWIKKSEVFITYMRLIEKWPHLEALKGKTLIVDYLEEDLRQRLENVGVAQVLELVPKVPELETFAHSTNVMTAVFDQMRILEDSPLSFNEYALHYIADVLEIEPNEVKEYHRLPTKCAFVLHPLSTKQISNAPGLRWLRKGSPRLMDLAERSLSQVPILKVGELTGAKSEATGQEVTCDIYALLATPKELLRMRVDRVYDQLVSAAEKARNSGCSLIGLGAYTKVVGDAGVTVAKRAPIPVTTGNSYTVAATLWAARDMVNRMGFVKLKDGKRIHGKSMVIGASGSIGRICSLLLSFAFDELILVGTRWDKLLEVRDEILEHSPKVNVKITTDADSFIKDADVIITATSAQNKKVLDILKVKPGAVICDCSRPLDVTKEDADARPDVIVIESGEIDLPGNVKISIDIGLPGTSIYACWAETILLAMEGRFESFSLSRHLTLDRVKEIYAIGKKHGARLSTIRGPQGVITEEQIERAIRIASEKRKPPLSTRLPPLARKRKSRAKGSR